MLQDILEFIENSPDGVVIFTFGSVIAISSLAEQVQEAIIEGLGRVPQRVLLKYEDEMTTDLPNNIMTRKWFPQRDILCKTICYKQLNNLYFNSLLLLFF